jgi:hypothetical protein
MICAKVMCALYFRCAFSVGKYSNLELPGFSTSASFHIQEDSILGTGSHPVLRKWRMHLKRFQTRKLENRNGPYLVTNTAAKEIESIDTLNS